MQAPHDLANRILQLSNTMLEGLEHVKTRTLEGSFLSTAPLFADIIEAFSEVERVISSDLTQARSNLLKRTNTLRSSFDLMTSAYEGATERRPLEVMQFVLLPACREWQACLRESLGP